MENEGPYRTGDATCIVFRVGVGEAENFDSERDALNASRLANTAYAEGRKSMDKDFRELLEIAEDLYVGCEHHLARCSFVDWKKARGIE